jgi:hypothetical protein
MADLEYLFLLKISEYEWATLQITKILSLWAEAFYVIWSIVIPQSLISQAVLRFNLAFVFSMNKTHDGVVHLFELFSLGRKAGL